MQRVQVQNAIAVADEGIRRWRNEQVVFLVAASHNEEQPHRHREPRSDSQSVAATNSSPWDCIAEAETGSDYTMHGSTYSTAFGMVNDIIYDYGTPEEQTAVFNGTATKETQIRIAAAFAADHGFGGWGELTKQKCGL